MAGYHPPRPPAIAHFPPFLPPAACTVPFSSVIFRRGTLCLALLALAATTACAPLRPSARGSGLPRVAAPSADPLAGPWTVRDADIRRSQVLTTRALLTSEIDGVSRVDTLHSTLEFAWSPVPGTAPARLAGLVTTYAVAVGGGPASVPAGVTLPFSFTAEHRVDGAQPEFTIPDGASCTLPNAAAVHGVRESWLSLPTTLERGTAWQDSSSYLMCRDGIPLRVSAVRTFVASGARMRDGQLAVLVQRATRLHVAGEGLQFGEPITIVGEGAGTMLLEVALVGGVILHAEGMSELALTMEGRRRRQILHQASRVEIREP